MEAKKKWFKPLVNRAAMVIADNALEVLKNYLLQQVEALKLPTMSKTVSDAISTLNCVVRIFLDDNPNNKAQLLQLLSKHGFVHADNATELAADIIKLRVKNPVLAASLERMARAAIEEPELADAHDANMNVPVYAETEGRIARK